MYIDLGGDTVIRASELVAILDLSGEKSGNAAAFFADENQLKQIVKLGDEETKSLVVARNGCYFSPVSVVTLKKRILQAGPASERVSNSTK
ncbi:MAG: hypothetical protein BAA02_12595 [Paenibacillaceae bacterium ZCTH02-B3]|nr:MAG: hypothetical protein BAA02_12595 [Paenibacillaceae bacterium ZCTH02-B3]